MESERRRKREYREILGIDENADEEILKKAYKKLVLKYHPDKIDRNDPARKEEAEIMFKKVTEAYEALQADTSTLNALKSCFKSQEIHSSLEQFFCSNAAFQLGSFHMNSQHHSSSVSVSSSFQTTSNMNASNPLSSFSIASVLSSSCAQNQQSCQATTSQIAQFLSHSLQSHGNGSAADVLFSAKNLYSNKIRNPIANLSTVNGGTGILHTHSSSRKGQSLQATLKIGFSEGLFGCQKTIEFMRRINCEKCCGSNNNIASVNHNGYVEGSSSNSGSSRDICRDCFGKGFLSANIAGEKISTACPSCHKSFSNAVSLTGNKGGNMSNPSFIDSFQSKDSVDLPVSSIVNSESISMPLCGTTHETSSTSSTPPSPSSPLPENPEAEISSSSSIEIIESTPKESCQYCGGTGKIQTKRKLTVVVPPGVSTGMQQTFEGEGDEGQSSSDAGDLIVRFDVEKHSFYERCGDDVHCKIGLPFTQAILGTKLQVPSIYGDKVILVEVKPFMPLKFEIKVTEEGFLNSTEGKRGDMYLQLSMELPNKLDDEEKNLLQQLATRENFKFHHPFVKSFPN